MLSTNQNECKRSVKWVFCALWESGHRIQGESPIQSLSLRHSCVHTEECTHPDPTLTTAADPFMKLCLWRLMIEKDTDCLLPHPRCSLSLKIEPWRQTLITTPKAGSPALPFQWGQQPLPRPVVAPSCKIDCSYSAAKYMTSQILSLFLNPKPVNSRKKSVSSQCFTVTCYNTENISKRDRTRRLERIYLCGRPAGV